MVDMFDDFCREFNAVEMHRSVSPNSLEIKLVFANIYKKWWDFLKRPCILLAFGSVLLQKIEKSSTGIKDYASWTAHKFLRKISGRDDDQPRQLGHRGISSWDKNENWKRNHREFLRLILLSLQPIEKLSDQQKSEIHSARRYAHALKSGSNQSLNIHVFHNVGQCCQSGDIMAILLLLFVLNPTALGKSVTTEAEAVLGVRHLLEENRKLMSELMSERRKRRREADSYEYMTNLRMKEACERVVEIAELKETTKKHKRRRKDLQSEVEDLKKHNEQTSELLKMVNEHASKLAKITERS